MKTILYWFKQDLRLHDMQGLYAIDPQNRLLPIYVFDPRQNMHTEYGFPKMGKRRLCFLEQSVLALQQYLRSSGSDLLIFEGKPEEIIPKLIDLYAIHAIHTEKDIAPEEIQVQSAIQEQIHIPIIEFESRTVFQEQDLPWSIHQLPHMFTEFRKGIEKHIGYDIEVMPITHLPTLPEIDFTTHIEHVWSGPKYQHWSHHPKSAIRAIGGEYEGLKRLHDYTFGTHAIATYKETRNGMIGDAYSSKFSPWLATGALSARQIIHVINEYESQFGANDSTYWMKFELLWREFFYWTLKKYDKKFFYAGGIRGKKEKHSWNQEVFDSWRFGETADPFVNAHMKELYLTGFMSNRGRQNVASYLIHELQQDWRIGASWFETTLIDYDVASNWGNWMYLAGVGNDPRQDRVFNTKKQAEMYDPQGEYQDLWIDELMAKNDY